MKKAERSLEWHPPPAAEGGACQSRGGHTQRACLFRIQTLVREFAGSDAVMAFTLLPVAVTQLGLESALLAMRLRPERMGPPTSSRPQCLWQRAVLERAKGSPRHTP